MSAHTSFIRTCICIVVVIIIKKLLYIYSVCVCMCVCVCVRAHVCVCVRVALLSSCLKSFTASLSMPHISTMKVTNSVVTQIEKCI